MPPLRCKLGETGTPRGLHTVMQVSSRPSGTLGSL